MIGDTILNSDIKKIGRGGRFDLTDSVELARENRDNLVGLGKGFAAQLDSLDSTRLPKEQSQAMWANLARSISDSTKPGMASIRQDVVRNVSNRVYKAFGGSDYTLHNLTELAFSTPSQVIGKDFGTIEGKAFYALRNNARDELYKKLSQINPKLADDFANLYKNYSDASYAHSFFKAANENKINAGGLLSKLMTQNIAGIIATGGQMNPVTYILANYGSGILYDLFVKAGITSKLSAKQLKIAAKKIGYETLSDAQARLLKEHVDSVIEETTQKEAAIAVGRQNAKEVADNANMKLERKAKQQEVKDYYENEPYVPEDKLPVIQTSTSTKKEELPIVKKLLKKAETIKSKKKAASDKIKLERKAKRNDIKF